MFGRHNSVRKPLQTLNIRRIINVDFHWVLKRIFKFIVGMVTRDINLRLLEITNKKKNVILYFSIFETN